MEVQRRSIYKQNDVLNESTESTLWWSRKIIYVERPKFYTATLTGSPPTPNALALYILALFSRLLHRNSHLEWTSRNVFL